jgi:UDP-glucose 4-epimerase
MGRLPSVLITGGAGFIGAHLTRALLADERYASLHLVVLDDLSGGFQENVPASQRLTFRRGSVTDHHLVDRLFDEFEIRYVFHLAAYAAEGLSHFIRRFNYTNNLIGSVNLINASVRHQVERFVFTSSIAVYGAAQVPMLESASPHPEDPYGIAKLAVEQDLKSAAEQFGLHYTIFRPHNVYGEFQNIGDRYRNVVGIFMNRIMQKQPLPVFGDGQQQRAFTYIGDLTPALVSSPFLKSADCEIFNIGAAVPVTILQLAQAVGAEFGVDPELQFLPPRSEVRLAWSDHAKTTSAFGPAPSTTLADGLHRMAQWAREIGPRKSPPFSDIEITEGLPPSWRDLSAG